MEIFKKKFSIIAFPKDVISNQNVFYFPYPKKKTYPETRTD